MSYPTTIWLPDPSLDDDREIEVKLPVHFEVCVGCRGQGVTTSHIDGNGITGDEMRELGQAFKDDYLSGVYDRPCPDCGGKRVQEVVDRDRLTPAHLKAYIEICDDHDDAIRERAAEMRAGC